MSADEIRRLAESIIAIDRIHGQSMTDTVRGVMLTFAAMVERCNEVNHNLVRDISAMNGYPLNMDAKDFVEKINYILRGYTGKEGK